MPEPAHTRAAPATTAVPGNVGASPAAAHARPTATVENVDAAAAMQPPDARENVARPQPHGIGQWLGRHAVVAVLLLGLIVYGGYELSALFFAYTGDAYVDADVIVLAPRVEGPVDKLAVIDNSVVLRGELLFEILPTPYALAVAELEAGIKLAQTNLTQARDKVSETEAEIEQRQAVLNDARATQARYQDLFDRQVVARQELDNATRDEKVAQAILLGAQDRLASAKQGVVVQRPHSRLPRGRSTKPAISWCRPRSMRPPMAASRRSRRGSGTIASPAIRCSPSSPMPTGGLWQM